MTRHRPIPRMWGAALLALLVIVGTSTTGVPTAEAAISTVRLTKGVSTRPAPAGGIFLEADLVVQKPAVGGATVLTGSVDGKRGLLVDDAVEVTVTHPSGSTAGQFFRFNAVCASALEAGNVDLTPLLETGRNVVHLAFRDHCGGNVSATPVYVRGSSAYRLTDAGSPSSVKVAAAVAPRPASPGDVFLRAQFTVVTPKIAGWGVLTASKDGLTPLLVDDLLAVEVRHPDGTTVRRENRFNPVCAVGNEPANLDLTELLVPGRNVVTLQGSDVCGGAGSSRSIYFRGPGHGGGADSVSAACAGPTRNLVRCYAPEVRLHPEESAKPISPTEFISKSELRWSADQGCRDVRVVKRGDVSRAALGSGRYVQRQTGKAPACKHDSSGKVFHSNDLTRPHDDHATRDSSLSAGEGFFLDVKNSAHSGDPVKGNSVTTKLYYDRGTQGGQDYITYWFFYAYNPAADADAALVDRHEGDWEHIRVWLTADGDLDRVSFGQHGCADKTYPAFAAGSPVVLTDLHPVVYSAKGSHASFPKPQQIYKGICSPFQGVADVTKNGGPVWKTWDHLGGNMSKANWARFGGAWGEVGLTKAKTGPLGPAWK